jgi:hypothetical protein
VRVCTPARTLESKGGASQLSSARSSIVSLYIKPFFRSKQSLKLEKGPSKYFVQEKHVQAHGDGCDGSPFCAPRSFTSAVSGPSQGGPNKSGGQSRAYFSVASTGATLHTHHMTLQCMGKSLFSVKTLCLLQCILLTVSCCPVSTFGEYSASLTGRSGLHGRQRVS